MRRIRAASEVFAERLGVDPPAFADIPKRGGQDVVRMKEHEALADWMEQAAEALGGGPVQALSPRPSGQQTEEGPSLNMVLAAINAPAEERTSEQQEALSWFLERLVMTNTLKVGGQGVEPSAQGNEAQAEPEADVAAEAPAADGDDEPAADPLPEPQEDPDGGDPGDQTGAPGDAAPRARAGSARKG